MLKLRNRKLRNFFRRNSQFDFQNLVNLSVLESFSSNNLVKIIKICNCKVLTQVLWISADRGGGIIEGDVLSAREINKEI